jgi:hypothetical protein
VAELLRSIKYDLVTVGSLLITEALPSTVDKMSVFETQGNSSWDPKDLNKEQGQKSASQRCEFVNLRLFQKAKGQDHHCVTVTPTPRSRE